jgi:predicted ABC-type ATPase
MYVIAGPNGAGKSTLYEHQIKNDPVMRNVEFVNADLIQREQLNDLSPEASYKAARIAEARRRELIAKHQSFITESTFSHPSKLELIDDAKAQGFRVAILHIQVSNPDIAVDRVRQRVDRGGHPVPEHKIRERFTRNPALIRQAVLKADAALVYDNSDRFEGPRRIIQFERGRITYIEPAKDPNEIGTLPTWVRQLYAEDLRQFSTRMQ